MALSVDLPQLNEERTLPYRYLSIEPYRYLSIEPAWGRSTTSVERAEQMFLLPAFTAFLIPPADSSFVCFNLFLRHGGLRIYDHPTPNASCFHPFHVEGHTVCTGTDLLLDPQFCDSADSADSPKHKPFGVRVSPSATVIRRLVASEREVGSFLGGGGDQVRETGTNYIATFVAFLAP